MEAARAFDLAFARARLAREWGLTRPRLGEGPVRVQGGRLLPCEEACRARGLGYTPLEACFDTPATVIFGSNMGGKTVVLKTLAFLQLCAQTGLFVPAARFETRAFRHFHYVGEGRDQEAALGLSGFGREIRQFNGAWGTLDEPTLVLFDEFARTTQSLEAEALLSAVLASLGERPGAFALFSTHFRGVARLEGVRYLRMGGLRPGGAGTGQDPLRLIGERMDYRLLPDGGAPASSDALAVAELLGLDPAVLARTRQAFNHVL
jgi:DNA mismatch repair ATPase MutS